MSSPGGSCPGRRYSDGLHQALEAKEKVRIENENQTLASITFQNYFRMYDKLAGMTGTADTEAAEFKKIYDLDVVVVPTHKPMIRNDFSDVIYNSRQEKYDAALEEIVECYKTGQPVLVGTISVEVSEMLAKRLERRRVPHNVLNAKNHAKEAEIISQAGQKRAVTISTNMAGRGTDIVLGEGVIELGGLHILGTERHESRRIDNQLRGRSGRQGDPGSSRFYLSLEDDLLRIFGGEKIRGVMGRMGMTDGQPIEHPWLSKAVENAQRKVEGHNFDIRKQLLEYDDVMNQQREVIYRQRRQALSDQDLRPHIQAMIEEKAEAIALAFAQERVAPVDWDRKGLEDEVFAQFNFYLDIPAASWERMTPQGLADEITDQAKQRYAERIDRIGPPVFAHAEKMLMLQVVDQLWKDHLLSMDHLKEGIGLRGYAQQNPLIVYKREGFEMFQNLIGRIKQDVVAILFRFEVEDPAEARQMEIRRQQQMSYSRGGGQGGRPQQRQAQKVGRNAPCPCGSGKKYKHCCGASH